VVPSVSVAADAPCVVPAVGNKEDESLLLILLTIVVPSADGCADDGTVGNNGDEEVVVAALMTSRDGDARWSPDEDEGGSC
jgi:hypothetical protein